MAHRPAALPLGRAPQTARLDTRPPGRHAVAWPTFLWDTLLVPHAPFLLEWVPTLVDTSTWFSSLPLLSLVSFSALYHSSMAFIRQQSLTRVGFWGR